MEPKLLRIALGTVMAVAVGTSAGAQDLLEKAKEGDPVRLGFANEVP